MMGILRGLFRISAAVLLLGFYTLIILIAALIPARIRGARIPSWLAVSLSRSLLRLFDVRCEFRNIERLRQFEGFIFPNHVSLFDILVLHSIVPVRFLSKAEIRKWPFIGWIAIAIETVFVNRADKQSRASARQALLTTTLHPPLVLFPEGGINPPADTLKPFRYGAFEIAAAREKEYLPCVLQYTPLQLAFWEDDELPAQIWELATRKEPLQVRITMLHKIHADKENDPKQLALEAHGMMDAVLRYGGQEEKVVESGL